MKLHHAALTIGAILAAGMIWLHGKPWSLDIPSASVTDTRTTTSELRFYDQANGSNTSLSSGTDQVTSSQPAQGNARITPAVVTNGTTVVEYEQQFYAGDALRLDKLIAATETESFAELFHALESSALDPELRQQSRRLNDKVRSLPALQSGAISLQRFACGSRFCAAAFFSQDEAVWTKFHNSLSGQLELPEGGVSFTGQSGEQGNWEQRLIFSIDGGATRSLLVEENTTRVPIGQ